MEKIPVIDFGKILGSSPTTEEDVLKVANEIYDACHGIGFMYIVNHGIPQSKVQAVLDENVKFFSLPQSRKEEFKFETYWGYMKPGQEVLTPDFRFEMRESFSVVGASEVKGQKFPEELPNFGTAYNDLVKECNILTRTLLTLFSKALKLPNKNYFVDSSRGLSDESIPNHTALRSQYYYRIGTDVQIDENSIRCAEHTDYGTCTLLFQDSVGGLEVKNAQGQWIPATPIEGSIIVNLGDVMEMWTGGRFKATPHRVIVPPEAKLQGKARQSIAYFVSPDDDYVIHPIKSNDYNGVVIDFEAIKHSDFLKRRLQVSQRPTY